MLNIDKLSFDELDQLSVYLESIGRTKEAEEVAGNVERIEKWGQNCHQRRIAWNHYQLER